MQLHALLNATEPYDGGAPDQLRALTPILQETLLERQAYDAIAVGATRIMVHVGIVAPELIKATDRLRARAIAVEFVRTTQDIIRHIQPDDQILLVADGLHAKPAHYAAIITAASATHGTGHLGGAALVTGDTVYTRGLERIDATDRWAGLAIISGGIMDKLGEIPDDWDACSTILRHAVQVGVQRQRCEAALFEQGQIVLVTDTPTADMVEQVILGSTQNQHHGLGQTLIWAPIVRIVSALVLRAKPLAWHYWGIAAAFYAIASSLAYAGFLGAALITGALSGLGKACAQHVSVFRAQNRFDEPAQKCTTIFGLLLIIIIGISAHVHVGESVYVAVICGFVALILAGADYFAFLAKTSLGRSWAIPDTDSSVLFLMAGHFLGSIGAGASISLAAGLAGFGYWVHRHIAHDAKNMENTV